MKYSYIRDYMGARFRHDAYGEDGCFDCYGLVWHIAKHHGGIELPRFDDYAGQLARINAAIDGAVLSSDWREVSAPQDFDAVVMRRAGEAYHVGCWLGVDDGKVLHATPQGVLCNDLAGLRRMNFQHITFYRYIHADH
ncbi:hypothetical protein PHACT_12515 [Pseudohongiella acticola]|uniref:NlpC/P60 domain-containing protein n=1 Tax=Pseudohongiella acticola TaxID=1524254 RepID=A0A1E8CFY3_9GAMM|nr:NlpC/P60 family protein [Pseudohongiella acticola]OFE11374.1 hypothetical protein PHACT_12515 [Pseudohongiella acticola]